MALPEQAPDLLTEMTARAERTIAWIEAKHGPQGGRFVAAQIDASKPESVAAVAVVLLLITLGALFADLISEIAKGKVPAGLLLSQLGLRSIRFLTLVLPLALWAVRPGGPAAAAMMPEGVAPYTQTSTSFTSAAPSATNSELVISTTVLISVATILNS